MLTEVNNKGWSMAVGINKKEKYKNRKHVRYLNKTIPCYSLNV